MKALLIATTLMFGTAAMAQDMGGQMPPANQPTAGPNGASPAPDTTMPQTSDTPASPAADPAMSPQGSPTAQAPMSSGSSMASGGAPMASDPSSYPPCSRTVTDKCVSGGKKMAKSKGMKHKM